MRGLIAFIAASFAMLRADPADALVCQLIGGCSCTVSATDMAFGNVTPGVEAGATADVSIHCTGLAELFPSIGAKIGPGAHGALAARKMQSAGGAQLTYNIYDAPASSTILGEGAGGYPMLTLSGGILGLGQWQVTGHLYGRMTPPLDAQAGAYSDTVTVRIDW
ncbi:MAG: spore coat protein U domain-containing protein [Hyphomonadaceae bacterium]